MILAFDRSAAAGPSSATLRSAIMADILQNRLQPSLAHVALLPFRVFASRDSAWRRESGSRKRQHMSIICLKYWSVGRNPKQFPLGTELLSLDRARAEAALERGQAQVRQSITVFGEEDFVVWHKVLHSHKALADVAPDSGVDQRDAPVWRRLGKDFNFLAKIRNDAVVAGCLVISQKINS